MKNEKLISISVGKTLPGFSFRNNAIAKIVVSKFINGETGIQPIEIMMLLSNSGNTRCVYRSSRQKMKRMFEIKVILHSNKNHFFPFISAKYF
jgi:hypothetical protein